MITDHELLYGGRTSSVIVDASALIPVEGRNYLENARK